MVVPVLITSCHVSDHWKSGPVIIQINTTPKASMKAAGCPAKLAVRCENAAKNLSISSIQLERMQKAYALLRARRKSRIQVKTGIIAI